MLFFSTHMFFNWCCVILIVCVSMVTLHCVCNTSVLIYPEVNAYRLDLEGITVKGKGCPKPIKTWVQCGVSMKILNALKKWVFNWWCEPLCDCAYVQFNKICKWIHIWFKKEDVQEVFSTCTHQDKKLWKYSSLKRRNLTALFLLFVTRHQQFISIVSCPQAQLWEAHPHPGPGHPCHHVGPRPDRHR